MKLVAIAKLTYDNLKNRHPAAC